MGGLKFLCTRKVVISHTLDTVVWSCCNSNDVFFGGTQVALHLLSTVVLAANFRSSKRLLIQRFTVSTSCSRNFTTDCHNGFPLQLGSPTLKTTI